MSLLFPCFCCVGVVLACLVFCHVMFASRHGGMIWVNLGELIASQRYYTRTNAEKERECKMCDVQKTKSLAFPIQDTS